MPNFMDAKLFEATPGMRFVFLPDAPRFTIVAATNDICSYVNRTREQLVGSGIFEAFPSNPSDASNTGESDLLTSLMHVLQHKKPHQLPTQRYDVKEADGTFVKRYWKVENLPVLDTSNKVEYIIHTTEDITEQVHAEEITESMKGLQQAHNLFLQAPMVIGIVRGEDLILELANQDALTLWNKTEDIIGKPLLEGIPELKGQDVCQRMLDVMRTGKIYQASKIPVTTLNEGKEELHYFDLYYKPYSDIGSETVSGVFTISIDVTQKVLAEQKAEESEDRFRVLADQTPMMVFITDINANITYSNTYWLKYTGQTADETIGNSWKQIVHPEDYDNLLRTYQQATKEQQNYSIEVRLRRADGEYRYFLFTGGPRYSSNSVMLGNIGTAIDVHDRKKAEEDLKKSELNLRNTILQSPVAMCIFRGPAHVVEIANDRMFELWGRGKEEILSKSVFEALPEVKDQGYEELLNSVFTTGERYVANAIPVTLPRENGIKTVYINLLYEAYKETDGTISGIIAVAMDVTEQVLARKRVEESNQEFKFVTDFMPQMIWVTRPDGYHYYYNQQWYEYTGLTYEETAGEGWNTVFHPDDQDRAWKVWRSSLETGEPYEIEYRCKRFDGEYRWFLGRALPLKDATGNILKWFGTCTDIDDQKKSADLLEEKVVERTRELESQKNLLDNILKNSSNGISATKMIRDDKGIIYDAKTILANDSAVRYVGLPKEIYMTKSAVELYPDILSSPYGQTCLKTLETGEPSLTQYRIEALDRWLELTISKMDEDHLIHIFTDITPIKEAQVQLEETIEELKRSNTNLEDFAYAASHDLKEPIRKIRTFSDRLKDKLQGRLLDEDKHYFERMQKATERMQLLIDDLLEYSHISASHAYLDEIDLNKKVAQVLEDVELEIAEKHARITVDPLPVIKGHRRQIQQLFQNLITNALKFTKANITPEIKISYSVINGGRIPSTRLAEHSTDSLYHLIEVSDNGIGFEQAHGEKIFKMFQRLHGKSEYNGTGIGLAIVKKVIENHKGFILAESQLGEGATFKVYLPVS